MQNLNSHWKNICKIYFLTKHYLLLSEELSEDFDTFLQPLKEHRDAFDHIARVYGYDMSTRTLENVQKYKEENMKKAVGHAYRAFFDTADWLSYICRKKIRETLSPYTKEQILALYPQYPESKKLLNSLPLQIAEIRENKDLSDDETILIEEVNQYVTFLDQLLAIYHTILECFS